MFSWKNTPPIRTLIGEGTVLEGKSRFSAGLRIDGEVLGDITATGERRSLVVISERGHVSGRVCAGHVIINGSVSGPVEAGSLL